MLGSNRKELNDLFDKRSKMEADFMERYLAAVENYQVGQRSAFSDPVPSLREYFSLSLKCLCISLPLGQWASCRIEVNIMPCLFFHLLSQPLRAITAQSQLAVKAPLTHRWVQICTDQAHMQFLGGDDGLSV